jgi:penicillin-binding protein 2
MEESRKFIIRGFFILIALIYLFRLFYLQVIDDSYKVEAEGNAIKKIIQMPFRGQIYDRTNKLIVYNTPVYDLYITPKKAMVADTNRFCQLLGLSHSQFDSLASIAKAYSPVKPSPFIRQLSVEDFARVQDAMVDYPGFTFEKRALRNYQTRSSANVLGYISEISETELLKQEEAGNGYYRQGDYVGKSGIEKQYEEILRGRRGVKYMMVNVRGVEKGAWQTGKYDTLAVAGQNLITSLDLGLQEFGDSLMQHKVGSIVAIEPSTGEVLCMVSAPSYDPSLLSGRNFSRYYSRLLKDPNKPLINRPLQAQYRPGSTFKLIQALVGLQEGVISESSVFACGGAPVRCHGHASGDLRNAVRFSCNPYFYRVFQRIIYNNSENNVFKKSAVGLQKWDNYVDKFGIGQRIGIDLPNERRGRLPSVAYYNKVYKGDFTWKFSNIYSLSIGEGELDITPLKMANVAAIMANKGWYVTPHVVKGIGKVGNLPEELKERHETGIARRHFDPIIDGMVMVVNGGTVDKNARIPDIQMCGKTGTSQNRRGEDHSIFIAFAPAINPKIAIAVFVENAGFGGYHAAPIASLIIEKYLKGRTDRKTYATQIMNKSYLQNIPHAK